jgi:hypothetical protein
MKVRSVGVRRVWDCMMCAYVSEEGGDRKGAGSETPSLMSYILRYIFLGELALDGKTGLVPGLVPGFQGWKCPGTLAQTWH